MKNIFFVLLIAFISTQIAWSQRSPIEIVEQKANKIENEVIEWRRHFHEFPELSNREVNTAKYIAKQLRAMGLEVEEGIAKTGVVGFLKGSKQGPTVGLRADIDGLPVTEQVDLAFASKETTQFLGKDVGVMHACGHDTHTAMLLGAAKVLTDMKDQINGNVVFVFQPAEEGPPPGEEGGANLMVKEGILEKYGVEVMFGQHISSIVEVGHINYRVGGMMAAADRFTIKVKGKQAHGSRPWSGVDPIVTAAQIIMGLQTIVSRQTDLTQEAAVISVGKIEGGTRFNIIPEEVELTGTIRTLDVDMQNKIHEKIKLTAEHIAAAQGATVEVNIKNNCPITFNNPSLTKQMIQTLYDTAGEDNVHVVAAVTGGEDFAYFANEVPALYYFLGGKPKNVKTEDAPGHHTPTFAIDESGMILGVKSLVNLTLDYMELNKK